MDPPGQPLTLQLLEQEDHAWRNLTSDEYDQALCSMLETFAPSATTPHRLEALLALAEVTLRREGPLLIDSRACIAEHLLRLTSSPEAATARNKIHDLFLLAWQHLVAEAAAGPEDITAVPDLPAGVDVPYGADPQSITHPILRQRALDLETQHAREVDRWNATQLAHDHLNHLTAQVRALGQPAKHLATAMSRIPNLPPALQKLLRDV